MAGQVVPARTEAPPPVLATPAEKRKHGAKALCKTSVRWAPRSTSARGHGRKSMKVVANLTLLEVEVGGGGVTSSHSQLDNLSKMIDTFLRPEWKK
jgi:hypothetical protein